MYLRKNVIRPCFALFLLFLKNKITLLQFSESRHLKMKEILKGYVTRPLKFKKISDKI